MSVASLACALALSAPPVTGGIPEGAVAWGVVPDLAATLDTLGGTAWKRVLDVAMPADVRAGLETHGAVASVAWIPGAKNDDGIGVVAAGDAAKSVHEALLSRLRGAGFEVGSAGSTKTLAVHRARRSDGAELFVFHRGEQVGWSLEERTARGVEEAAPDPPAGWRATQSWATGALGFGFADVQGYYGVLARRPRASSLAGNLERLGLLGLQWARARWTLEAGALRTEVEARWDGEWQGVFAALSGGVGALAGQGLPGGVQSVTRVSVQPATLAHALAKLFSYNRGLMYGVFRAQLGGLERRLGQQLHRDALGDDPQPWTVLGADGRVALGAKVADGAVLWRFVKAYGQAVPTIAPGNVAEYGKIGAADTMVVRRVRGRAHVAFARAKDTLWVARDRGALERALALAPKLAGLTSDEAQVLATGLRDEGRAAARDRRRLVPWVGDAAARRMTQLGQTRWVMERDGSAVRLDATTRPR